ncbi:hypothetical protein TBLA_0A04400 [Henningerozyma blattae CBS 6284]|uniref:Mitochondrial Rho GTPase n=1 Tax=Henningerozyma blattae (strain ATCC 34711 / CBS 6284 / DSM 70876 / NBRC 10599 / NRRL Y-10934 / UCD 77-7) TaxID=1071380 RepID=I2GVT3_HENB6|nr:hypothetical protein TBLA_0A04400 [Tetrapisispora blattae CBS 6284]CCH58235.1 hypothetical protein TBLA_0A04400 [Tetrapisispora blattae CBS 6284]
MSKETIKVVVCGDHGVGKSSLIISLVKGRFIPNVQKVLPQVTIPKDFSSNPYSPKNTILVDTDNNNPEQLQRELKSADVLWLVYSDYESYERLSMYWITTFRSLGLNLPVVLCKNKCDYLENESMPLNRKIEDDEFLPIMANFKEIETCIQASAKMQAGINQTFYLCQRAVAHPIAPLLDSRTSELKPLAIAALDRIFFLSDNDQDGFLNDDEIINYKRNSFKKKIDINELNFMKETLFNLSVTREEYSLQLLFVPNKGMTRDGFLALNKQYAEQGRHETTWAILRAFNYTNSLSIDNKILSPILTVPSTSSVELSSKGYRFLVDLFLKFDKDNDGGLNDQELLFLFTSTPGIPKLWSSSNFPLSTVVNNRSFITLQGWLAQWSMTTFIDYKVTTAYLVYFGFEEDAKVALQITRPRKIRRRLGKAYRAPVTDRTVFNCFIVGKPHCGKSSILESFLARTFSDVYSPTIRPKIAVNSLEMKGGKQCYLILQELGEQEEAILENKEKLDKCDVLCLLYDSSDPESFSYLIELLTKHTHLNKVPVIFVACKADLDKQQQRCDTQPDELAESLSLAHPLHISSAWPSSLNELFVTIADTALMPLNGTIGFPDDDKNTSKMDDTQRWMLVGSAIGVVAIFSFTLAKLMQTSRK